VKAYGRALGRAVWTRRVELGRFVVVGALNLILTYPVYLLLLRFLAYSSAYTICYVGGIFVSYWLNSHFVFRERMRLNKALQFPVVYLVQYFLSVGLLYLLVEWAHVAKALGPIIILLITVPVTYILSRFIIKRAG
jgi:putative flippase GtrA